MAHLARTSAAANALRLVLMLSLVGVSCSLRAPLLPMPLGQVAGRFELQRAGSRAWVRDSAGADIHAGDRVRTLDSDATVLLPGPSTLRIGPHTTLEVNGDSPSSLELVQTSGSVEVSTHTPLSLRTPLITAGVRGTVFKVDVLSALHSRLATIEGTVQVDMGQEHVLVPAGQEIDAHFGGTLASRPRTPEQPALLAVAAADGRLQVTGAAEPSRPLELQLDRVAVAQVQSDPNGRVSATLPAPVPGLHVLQAVALGSDSLRSEASPLLVFAWTERTAPLYVRFPSLVHDLQAGSNAWLIRGYTEPGARVRLEDQSALADANGLFSATVSVPPTANEIHATITADGRTLDMAVLLPS